MFTKLLTEWSCKPAQLLFGNHVVCIFPLKDGKVLAIMSTLFHSTGEEPLPANFLPWARAVIQMSGNFWSPWLIVIATSKRLITGMNLAWDGSHPRSLRVYPDGPNFREWPFHCLKQNKTKNSRRQPYFLSNEDVFFFTDLALSSALRGYTVCSWKSDLLNVLPNKLT